MIPVRSAIIGAALIVAACGTDQRGSSLPARFDVGRAASDSEIAALGGSVAPDGSGLPRGSGSVTQGLLVYVANCARCHGPGGSGIPPLYPPLVGRSKAAADFGFALDPNLKRTIGDYWPYATTLFDYIRRAMPFDKLSSLTDDETYAVTAYLLAANGIIPQGAVLDSASLVAVRMPAEKRFVRDNRRGGNEVR